MAIAALEASESLLPVCAVGAGVAVALLFVTSGACEGSKTEEDTKQTDGDSKDATEKPEKTKKNNEAKQTNETKKKKEGSSGGSANESTGEAVEKSENNDSSKSGTEGQEDIAVNEDSIQQEPLDKWTPEEKERMRREVDRLTPEQRKAMRDLMHNLKEDKLATFMLCLMVLIWVTAAICGAIAFAMTHLEVNLLEKSAWVKLGEGAETFLRQNRILSPMGGWLLNPGHVLGEHSAEL